MTTARLSHLCRDCYISLGAKPELLALHARVLTGRPCEGCEQVLPVYQLSFEDDVYGKRHTTKRQERREERQKQKDARRRYRQEAEWKRTREQRRQEPAPMPVLRPHRPSLPEVLSVAIMANFLAEAERSKR